MPHADAYDWCTVPDHPWDVILFAGIAIVASCVWQGSYQSLLVLISGRSYRVLSGSGAVDCTAIVVEPSRDAPSA